MAVLTDNEVGAIALQCDRCTNFSDDFSAHDFQAMIDQCREDGWKIARDERAEGGWSHECPDHTGKNRVAEHRKLLGL